MGPRRTPRRGVLFIIAGITLGGLAVYEWKAFELGFTESLYFRKGSFAYFVQMTSSTIKHFPQLQIVGEPK